MHDLKPATFNLIMAHIVPSFFFGMLLLIMFVGEMQGAVPFTEPENLRRILMVGAVTGLLTAIATAIFHHLLAVHLSPAGKILDKRQLRRNKVITFITAAICGGSTIFLLISKVGLLLLTTILMAVIIRHIRRFAHTIKVMFRPGVLPTAMDVWRFVEIYVNVLAGFTLLNGSINMLHLYGLLDKPQFPFGQGTGMLLDSLYFCVVTMTTLGFGDITPLTPLAKLLTIFECLTGYVMFALGVGMVTRGVVSDSDEG